MEVEFNPLTKTEALVAKSLRDYLHAIQLGDYVKAGQAFVELSSDVSHLFEIYLNTIDWDDGWLDGIPFYSITRTGDQRITFAGLFVWGDHNVKSFYLEPFQSRFELDSISNTLLSYLLCFRSHLKERQYIEYTSSEAMASRRIAIPDANDLIIESEWRYVFGKGADSNNDA
jgi:hypothetical protein